MANSDHVDLVLEGVETWNAWRADDPKALPDLREATLEDLDLSRIDLKGAELWRCNLERANLTRANLSGANLRLARLSGARLVHANLRATAFIGTDLAGVDFSHAALWRTLFCHVDLSTASGLETVKHHGPSTLGMDSLIASGDNVPLEFLHGVGIPDELAAAVLEWIQRTES